MPETEIILSPLVHTRMRISLLMYIILLGQHIKNISFSTSHQLKKSLRNIKTFLF